MMKSMDKQHVYIASVVATYWFVSISMVYLNKVLMSSEGVSIPAPLFITWFQCIVTAGICWVAGKVADKMKRAEYQALSKEEGEPTENDGGSKPSFWAQFPKAEYNLATGKRVFPLSLVFVGMITFNNICLNTLLGTSTSRNTMICLGVVIFGFLLGSHGEINFSLIGTLSGIMSSLFVSLNSIYTKKVLPVVDNDHWRLTFYNNVNATALFVPMMLIFESQALLAGFGKQFLSLLFWSAMMVAGFFGFSIGIVTVLQIKATSPLTHNISGTAKAAVQSMLAFYIWGNPATFFGVLGIFTVLGGSLAYTFVKMDESKKASSAPPANPAPETDKNDMEMPKQEASQVGQS